MLFQLQKQTREKNAFWRGNEYFTLSEVERVQKYSTQVKVPLHY